MKRAAISAAHTGTASAPLAVDTYVGGPALRDSADVLCLAWTLDEREILGLDTRRHLTDFLAQEIDMGLPNIGTYAVDDPYAERILRPALESFFAVGLSSSCVLTGAGVGGLLHALASLAAQRRVYVAGGVYPDLPFWVERLGGQCLGGPLAADLEAHLRYVRDSRPDVVFVERPGMFEDLLNDLALLRELVAAAGQSGAIVVVDESNANYCAPVFSAVGLTGSVANLVVLRGFSKAYSLGGIRLGCCVASAALKPSLRASIAPLGCPPLSAAIGASLLRLGDIAAPLRDRIAAHRSRTERSLGRVGISVTNPASSCLPYVFLTSAEDCKRIEMLGVLGKRHTTWRAAPRGTLYSYRLSIPLTEARMRRLEASCKETA